MTPKVAEIFNWIGHHIVPSLHRNENILLLVAAFMVANAILYGFTRGKEFAIGGYASALFIVPFLTLS
jgi:hypothetical protein